MKKTQLAQLHVKFCVYKWTLPTNTHTQTPPPYKYLHKQRTNTCRSTHTSHPYTWHTLYIDKHMLPPHTHTAHWYLNYLPRHVHHASSCTSQEAPKSPGRSDGAQHRVVTCVNTPALPLLPLLRLHRPLLLLVQHPLLARLLIGAN